MAYVLEILTGIFDRPSKTPAAIEMQNVGFYEPWIKAGLVQATDTNTGADILDADWIYGGHGGYRVTCRDGSTYVAKDRKDQVTLIWKENPVRAHHEWIGVYKEERINYIESRAKKLSKQESNHLFRFIKTWYGYQKELYGKNDKYIYYLNGLQITSDEAKVFFDNFQTEAQDRYQLSKIATDDLTAQDTLDTVAWRVETRSYSSYYVATLEATGRNKSLYRYTVIQDKVDLGAAAHVIIGGKEIKYQEMVKTIEGAIEHKKSMLNNIVKPGVEIKLRQLQYWDVNVPDLSKIAQHVEELASDLSRVQTLCDNPLYRERLAQAWTLLANATLALKGDLA